MPRAFSEHERKLIGERLLEQGRSQFAAYGLKKTNVGELAAAAGISKGALYTFYESKEALFMAVVEQAEGQLRQQVLAAVDLPGASPRARLFGVLKTAFTLWRTIPMLRAFTRSDYELLSGRVSEATVREHLAGDREFVVELVARCRGAGIPIQADVEEIDALLHAFFFISLHEDDLGAGSLPGTRDLFLELGAAYCLGEVRCDMYGGTTKDHGNGPAD